MSNRRIIYLTKAGSDNGITLINDPNLVAYWKLDGNTYDEKTQTTSYSTGVTYTTGKFGLGFSGDSTTDRINAYDETVFDFERNQAFSISFWYKSYLASQNNHIIAKQNPAAPYTGYAVLQNGNTYEFNVVGPYPTGYLAIKTPAASVDITKFQHIVATYNGTYANNTGLNVYIDSVLQSKTSLGNAGGITTILNNFPFQLGNRASDYNMSAVLDDVSVFNRLLTQADVDSLYTTRRLKYY